jgi:hypothetical protein
MQTFVNGDFKVSQLPVAESLQIFCDLKELKKQVKKKK